VAALALLSVAVAAVVAAALSGAFPIGPAATAEPSPGFSINVAWLLLGGAFAALALTAAAAGPTWRASRFLSDGPGNPAHSRRLVDVVSRSGGSPAAVVGVGMAIGTAPGRRSLQRLSIAGSIVAVGLLVGAVVFGTSLRHLLDEPVSYGWRWDAVASLDASNEGQLAEMQQYLAAVPNRPGILEAAVLENSAVDLGTTSVAAIGWRPVRGELAPTLLSGRLPTGPDEMALGGRTAVATGLTVGSEATVSGRNGAETMHVVGTVIFPSVAKYSGADNTDLGNGVLINQAALDKIAPAPGEQHLVVTVAPGVDPQAVLTSGYDDLAAANDLEVDLDPQRPGAIVDLGEVRSVPLWLATLAGLGATFAIGNLVASEVFRRRRDIALLKSMGFARSQVRRAVAWHATTIAVVTVVVAVPLGAVVGRVAWRFVAHTIGVSPVPASPVPLFLAILPLAVIVANVVAIVPARLAARTSIAATLRSE
jgi:putative ABC transport system permease protein